MSFPRQTGGILPSSTSAAAAGGSAAGKGFFDFARSVIDQSTQALSSTMAGAHNVLLPGIFLVLTVLSVNILGDGLRDTLDPKFNKRGRE